MKARIEQLTAPLGRAALDATENLIVFIPEKEPRGLWSKFPSGEILVRRLARARKEGSRGQVLETDLPNAVGTRVTVEGMPAEISAFELLSRARSHIKRHREHGAHNIAVAMPGLDQGLAARVVEAVTAAALAADAPMPDFRSKPPRRRRLSSLTFYGVPQRVDLTRTRAEAAGNALARELTMLPPNELTPGRYRRRIAALAREEGWTMRFLDTRALRRLRAGAFLAVVQGSDTDDAGIVELRYRPSARRSGNRELCLVGKGLCYDTGGVNLKPARYMQGMHEDMAGSAVALGTLLALTRLRAPFPVRCYLALAQNHIGPRAYKPGDVVTATNGTTIEVVHTDAEGRMVLADTLALASRSDPTLIIDYATLTGSCIHALGTVYSGAFTNRDALRENIIQAGRNSGERVWPFPFDADYDQALESRIADVRQCTLEGEADHILAARFLSRFVGDRPWIHIDLAAGSNKGGLAHIPTDTTGFGVRFTLDLLYGQQILERGGKGIG